VVLPRTPPGGTSGIDEWFAELRNATSNVADDLKEAVDAFLFAHERIGAGRNGFAASIRIVLERKDDDPCFGFADRELTSSSEPIKAVHVQVKHNHIRMELARQIDCCGSLARLTHNVEIWFSGHAHTQALANAGFIVN